MFDWDGNITFPKLTDIFNVSDYTNINWLDMFTHLWIVFLGNWFFAAVVGAIGAAVYMKYNNAMVTVAYFIVMSILLGAVLPIIFLTIIGIVSGFAIGILLYQTFISKEE